MSQKTSIVHDNMVTGYILDGIFYARALSRDQIANGREPKSAESQMESAKSYVKSIIPDLDESLNFKIKSAYEQIRGEEIYTVEGEEESDEDV